MTRILSTSDNLTIHYLNKNQFPSVYDLNTNLRKLLSIELRKEISDSNTSPEIIFQMKLALPPAELT